MKITTQLPGVNRPLSVELRLINFCSCGFDSQEEHDTSSSHGVLTKWSDFRSAQGLVQYSPFGGVEFGKKPRRYRRFTKKKKKDKTETTDPADAQESQTFASCLDKKNGKPKRGAV